MKKFEIGTMAACDDGRRGVITGIFENNEGVFYQLDDVDDIRDFMAHNDVDSYSPMKRIRKVRKKNDNVLVVGSDVEIVIHEGSVDGGAEPGELINFEGSESDAIPGLEDDPGEAPQGEYKFVDTPPPASKVATESIKAKKRVRKVPIRAEASQ